MALAKLPFPYYGGKSRAAAEVWKRFGTVKNYVEPFCGGCGVLLNRPQPFEGLETINDLNGFVCNFWRAAAESPNEVAYWADWPVSELDLAARHKWLMEQVPELEEKLLADPLWYDAKIAGWWAWGQCCWLGCRWCTEGKCLRQLPDLANGGCGLLAQGMKDLEGYFKQLADRLRRVRVCCGDWSRVVTPSATTRHGATAVLLDPPYGSQSGKKLYAKDNPAVAEEAREWAIANGNNPLLRIALCGYEGDYDMPSNWSCWAWKSGGSEKNGHRERIWYSTWCNNEKT